MRKINPIEQSYRPGSDTRDDREKKKNKNRDKKRPVGPAVINHVISRSNRMQMKQLQLPFDDLDIELKVFELYLYRDPRARYKSYGTHVEFTLAKNMNQAEELFSNVYPNWWRTMGVKEANTADVVTKLESLQEQVVTCKFVLQALNINH